MDETFRPGRQRMMVLSWMFVFLPICDLAAVGVEVAAEPDAGFFRRR